MTAAVLSYYKNAEVLKEYTEAFSGISVLEESLVFKTALNELKFGLEKILGKAPADTADSDGGIVLGFCENIKVFRKNWHQVLKKRDTLSGTGTEKP